jgi:hypothetical protein
MDFVDVFKFAPVMFCALAFMDVVAKGGRRSLLFDTWNRFS